MRRRYTVRITAAVIGGAVLVTVASAGMAGSTRQRPRVGGAVIVGLPVEPPTLNPYYPSGAPNPVVDAILEGAYSPNGTGDLVPDLIVGDPKIETRPFSLTYTIKKDARWSDGRSITARDFWFTWRTLRKLNRTLPEHERFTEGELIRKASILRRKKVKFVLTKPYGGWREFFPTILPSHALAGEDFTTVWQDTVDNPKNGRSISSGPFIFASWRHGSQLTLVRNRHYWRRKAYLGQLAFRAVRTTGFPGGVQALLAHKVDVVGVLAKTEVEELGRHKPGIRIRRDSGSQFEHLDFQLGKKGNPALKKPFVRRAIALAIDRKALASTQPLGAKALRSLLFTAGHPAYKPHWQRRNSSPGEAIRLLRSKGCRRGRDKIFSCGPQRLSFRVLSTALPPRELEFAALAQQLRRVGIELRKDFFPRDLALRTLIPQGDWDLALFAWSTGPDPVGWEDIYGCKGRKNYQAYCNHEVTRLLGSSSTALRTRRRWVLANRADKLIARDMPTVPLFVPLDLVAYRSDIQDIGANVQDWWRAGR